MLYSGRYTRTYASHWAVAAAMLLFLVIVGCRNHVSLDDAAPLVVPPADSRVSSDSLDAGRAIYVSETKCARCHSPKPVYDHTPQEWAKNILPRMGQKAKLSPEEYDCVLAYVTTGSQTLRKGTN